MSLRSLLITGVSRRPGIGAAVALRAARSGFGIFFTHFRPYDRDMPDWSKTDEDFEDVVKAIQCAAIESGHCECDLRDVHTFPSLIRTAEDTVGPLYALINNACYSVDTDLDALEPEIIRDHLAVNVTAPMLLSKEFVRRFRQSGHETGRIINFVSGYRGEPNPGNLAYSASKAALDRFTVGLAAEVASLGITANAVDPGPTDTGWMDQTLRASLEMSSPSGRVGTPEDVANLIEFLLSDNSQWITGQSLHSRGGL